MLSCRRWFPLERFFLVLLLCSGLFLFIIASTLIQQSRYESIRNYLAVKRDGQQHSLPDGLGGEKKRDKGGDQGRATKRASEQDGTKSVTSRFPPPAEPQWLGNGTNALQPMAETFRNSPATNRTHPFLSGYVIEGADVCSDATVVDLLIVIHSAVKNSQRRRILRETWAATDVLQGVTVRRVFLLGRDASGGSAAREEQLRVNTEAAAYGDVVQGDFLDTFPNLSRKAVTGLRWVHDHCPQARFILKADDDVFVDVFSLTQHFLQRLAGRSRAVLCHAKAANTSVIVRSKSSRWYVPPSILPNVTYWPTFCSGYVIVMTSDVASELYKASFDSPYIPVDDAFVYGILPQVAAMAHTLHDNNTTSLKHAQEEVNTNSTSQFNFEDISNATSQTNASDTTKDIATFYRNIKTFFSGKPFLNITDIGSNLTLVKNKMLNQYKDTQKPVTIMAGFADNDADLVDVWQAVMNRLSPWAKFKSTLARMQSKMAAKIL